MTDIQARELLKISEDIKNEDDIYDAFELALFETKNYFLTNAIIPVLFLKRLQKVFQLQEALILLAPNCVVPKVEWVSKPILLDKKLNFIQQYENASTALKLELSSLIDASDIDSCIKYLLRVTDLFERNLLDFVYQRFGTEEKWAEGYSRELKISQGIDTVMLNKYLFSDPVLISDELRVQELFAEVYKVAKKHNLAVKSV